MYIGWNWADGADPAWIVVIAHRGSLRTWYAHMQPKRPVSVGQSVKKGQVIGYEGSDRATPRAPTSTGWWSRTATS